MSAPPPGPITDLPVGATVAAAYRTFFAQLRYLPRAMAVPFLMSILLWIGTLMIIQLGEIFTLLSLVPYTIFGVTWYRLNLLGPVAGAPHIGLSWQTEHWRFLRYAIVVALINMVGLGLAVSPLIAAVQSGGGASLGAAAFTIGALLAIAYLILRFSFVFPAAAVGEIYGFKHAFRHSSGQGWRLLLGLMFVLLPLIALTALLAPLISAPFMNAPESADLTGEEIGATLSRFQLISLIFEYPLMAVTMTYIAIAFQTCTGWVADHGSLPATQNEPEST